MSTQLKFATLEDAQNALAQICINMGCEKWDIIRETCAGGEWYFKKGYADTTDVVGATEDDIHNLLCGLVSCDICKP